MRHGESVITDFPLLAVLCGNTRLDSTWCYALMDKEPFSLIQEGGTENKHLLWQPKSLEVGTAERDSSP